MIENARALPMPSENSSPVCSPCPEPAQQLQQRLADALAFADHIVQTVREPILVLDEEFKILSTSDGTFRLLHIQPGETNQKSIFEISHGLFNAPAVRSMLDAVRSARERLRSIELDVEVPESGHRILALHASAFRKRTDHAQLIILALDDLTLAHDAVERAEQLEQVRRIIDGICDYAIFSLNEKGQIIDWNEAAEHIFGYAREEIFGQHFSLIFTLEDRSAGAPEQELSTALREGRAPDERWHLCKDGSCIWAKGMIFVRRDREGQIISIVKVLRDLTQERLRAPAAPEEEEHWVSHIAEIRALADSMPQIVWIARPDGSNEHVNRQWYSFSGATDEQTRNFGWLNFLHPKDRKHLEEQLAESVRTGNLLDAEFRLRRHDNVYHWFLCRASAVRDKQGNILKWLVIGTDIDDRKRSDLRQRLLADASSVLASGLEYETSLQNMAALLVPDFADICRITMRNEDGSARRIAEAVNPLKRAALDELQRHFHDEPTLHHGEHKVLASGTPELVPQLSPALLRKLARDDAHFRLLEALQFKSYVSVPLKARGETLGSLSFISTEEGRSYAREDLLFAEELARRAALAIDNALLFQNAQRELIHRKRIEEELAAADRRKDEFLATLAHELRNPLAPIRHAMHVIRYYSTKDPSMQRAREIVERQVANMVRLVDDLLDVSRIQRGKINLRKERLALQRVIDSAIESASPLIQSRGHRLKVEVSPEPLMVQGDATRLEQSIVNLLSNAAKYTPETGEIWLSAHRDSNVAVIRVQDSGIGIAPDVLPHVFDLFTQADKSLERSDGGLGIGLTLVRHLVEMHGGTVNARSSGLGRGSEFEIRLPLAKGNHHAGPKEQHLPDADEQGPKSVLLVEDNADSRETLSAVLELWGHRVTVARDGAEALAKAAELHPAIALVDVGLPGINGYEVARRLRAQFGKSIVLIALTGYGQPEDRRQAFDAGFDAHLVKPADLEVLHRLIGGAAMAEH